MLLIKLKHNWRALAANQSPITKKREFEKMMTDIGPKAPLSVNLSETTPLPHSPPAKASTKSFSRATSDSEYVNKEIYRIKS